MSEGQTFSDADRTSIYQVIEARRDIRRFIQKPVPKDVLQRILWAAACAPSVGYMQPWNFILIRRASVRKQVHEAFTRANHEAQALFQDERAAAYSALKLEGILESALNICVTCDRSRFGPVVLGRTSQPDMDLYSTVCSVQNLWLAARAEGVGVGWVSILKPEDIANILALPEHVVPVAYLCVGYPESFPDQPELKKYGWLPQVPHSELIFHEEWGKKSPAF